MTDAQLVIGRDLNRDVPNDAYDKHCRHRPRKDESTTYATVEVGRRFRLGRQQAGMTQRSLAFKSSVSQSEIARFERGMTPHMSAYKVLEMGLALGPRFPFGYCPHDHQCTYSRPSPEVELWNRLDARGEVESSGARGGEPDRIGDASGGIGGGVGRPG